MEKGIENCVQMYVCVCVDKWSMKNLNNNILVICNVYIKEKLCEIHRCQVEK